MPSCEDTSMLCLGRCQGSSRREENESGSRSVGKQREDEGLPQKKPRGHSLGPLDHQGWISMCSRKCGLSVPPNRR